MTRSTKPECERCGSTRGELRPAPHGITVRDAVAKDAPPAEPRPFMVCAGCEKALKR